MGTLIILTIICKLLGKDIKWAQRQLRRLWRAITRPFRGKGNNLNDRPKTMKRSVRVYLISALVPLAMLVGYALFFAIGNKVVNNRLENELYKVACSELQIDLPEFADVYTDRNRSHYAYYDWFVEHNVEFAEPLLDKTLELLESRCGDNAAEGWEYEEWNDSYGCYCYNYDGYNNLWSYSSHYGISKERMTANYSIHEYTLGPFSAATVWFLVLLLWVVVVPVWGLTLLVIYIVRRCKNREKNLQ